MIIVSQYQDLSKTIRIIRLMYVSQGAFSALAYTVLAVYNSCFTHLTIEWRNANEICGRSDNRDILTDG